MMSPWERPARRRALDRAAARLGTPIYVHDLALGRARLAALRAALPDDTRVLLPVKANPSPAVLAALGPLADGLDVASLGELRRGVEAGVPAARHNLVGPAKTPAVLAAALDAGVGSISVESPEELEALAGLAAARAQRVGVRLRVAPDRRPHAYATPMAGVPTPFGLDEVELEPSVRRLLAAPALAPLGLHVHVGSECRSARAAWATAAAALDLVERLARDHGLPAPELDLGGGFAAPVGAAPGLDVAAYGAQLARGLAAFRAATGLSPRPVLEPGRWWLGPIGAYVVTVVRVKRSRGVCFAITDGGLHHCQLASPRLGAAARPILSLAEDGRPEEPVTITGPLCTPLDVLGEGVLIPEPRVGDRLAVLDVGAYGRSLSPIEFLSQPEPLEASLDAGE